MDAFKLLPTEPSLWQWHGIKCKGFYYFAPKFPFGSKSSLWLFNMFAQSLSWILLYHAHCQKVIHYLDDFLLIEKSGEPPVNLDSLREVFSNLNVSIAKNMWKARHSPSPSWVSRSTHGPCRPACFRQVDQHRVGH